MSTYNRSLSYASSSGRIHTAFFKFIRVCFNVMQAPVPSAGTFFRSDSVWGDTAECPSYKQTDLITGSVGV